MEDSYSSLSSTDSSIKDMYELPEGFKAHSLLGEGTYGVVLKCRDLKTNSFVAIKVAKYDKLRWEAFVLRILMDKGLDQQNIIKFHGGFLRNKCLAFEMLDTSLLDYLQSRESPMPLQGIRTVIRQLATALDGLKSIGMIHGDIKLNNIMLVDHDRQPFEVKLIDFGLAMFRNMATYRTIRQVHFCRAPEVILGLPISEAVDVWSLGCVMAFMLFAVPLFTASNNYDLLKQVTDLLGPPPNRIISNGQESHLFFKETETNEWEFKTPEEYWGPQKLSTDRRSYTFRCLDEMKMLRLEENNKTEAEDREECIELLKAMLTWDEKERITPSEILAHPFITMSYLNCTCDSALATQRDPNEKTGPSTNQAAQHDPYEATGPGTSQAAQPDPYEITGPSITQAAQVDPYKTEGPGITQATQPDPHETQHDPGPTITQAAQPDPYETTGPDVALAVQVDPYETIGPGITQVVQINPYETAGPSITQSVQVDPYETTGPGITQAAQPDPYIITGPGITQAAQPDPSKTTGRQQETTTLGVTTLVRLPSGLILVQPAPPQNRIPLGDTCFSLTSDSALAAQHDPNETTGPSTNQAAQPDPDEATGPSTSQAAQPDPSKTTGRQQETTTLGVTTLVRLPSGLILVQPAPPQNRIPLGDTSDEESISSNDSTSILNSTPAPAPTPFMNDTNNWPYKEEDKAKKTKKKNCIRRFFSWFKKTACSCCFVDNVVE